MRLSFCLQIKASEGGGGKGIRKCKNEADFKENFQQVQVSGPSLSDRAKFGLEGTWEEGVFV